MEMFFICFNLVERETLIKSKWKERNCLCRRKWMEESCWSAISLFSLAQKACSVNWKVLWWCKQFEEKSVEEDKKKIQGSVKITLIISVPNRTLLLSEGKFANVIRMKHEIRKLFVGKNKSKLTPQCAPIIRKESSHKNRFSSWAETLSFAFFLVSRCFTMNKNSLRNEKRGEMCGGKL